MPPCASEGGTEGSIHLMPSLCTPGDARCDPGPLPPSLPPPLLLDASAARSFNLYLGGHCCPPVLPACPFPGGQLQRRANLPARSLITSALFIRAAAAARDGGAGRGSAAPSPPGVSSLHVNMGHSMSCTSLSTSVRKSTVTSRSPLDAAVKDVTSGEGGRAAADGWRGRCPVRTVTLPTPPCIHSSRGVRAGREQAGLARRQG